MLVLEGETVLDDETGQYIKISDEMINQTGLEIEYVTGYEYLNFERLRIETHEDI